MKKMLSVPVAAAVVLCSAAAFAAPSPQVILPGSSIPQFAQPLPKLSVAGGTMQTVLGNAPVTLRMCEFQSRVLPPGTPVVGNPSGLTWTWGYFPDACPTTPQDTYIGPVIVAQRGTPTPVTYINDLGNAATTNVLAYKYGSDQTLHWADPLGEMCSHHAMPGMGPMFGSPCAQNYSGPVPAVPHLHGGEVPPMLDGGPDAWFTSDGLFKGPGYYTSVAGPANQATYTYPNTQEAGPLWFHDHTLGATRLNVYAGLAGAYVLTDPAQSLPANLPGPAEIVPLVIQDRQFDTNGQLFFQAAAAGGIQWALTPDHPYWSPEFVGDAIVVNGKAWPFLDVQPKRYRFLIINGSNARTYELSMTDQVTKAVGPSIWVIGNDGGYLDAPVKIDAALKQKLVIMPGERYEIMIDFAGIAAGSRILVKNTAKTPFPAGGAPNGQTTGRVIQFRVGACPAGGCPADTSYDPASGIPLRSPAQAIQRLVNPATGTLAAGVTPRITRQLTLNEVMAMPMTAIDPVTGALTAFPGGPVEILVNNTKWSGASERTYGDFLTVGMGAMATSYSEVPQEGDTEVWEIVNLTADAHPIHLHLVQFQVLNRQAFDLKGYDALYNLSFPATPSCLAGAYCPGFGPPLDYHTGNPRALGGNPDVTPFLKSVPQPPGPAESGWKDTLFVPPGAVTRFVVRWAPTDLPVSTPAAGLHYPFDPKAGFQFGYVWHCHIIDHEDNEMMRPDLVELNPLAPAPIDRPLQQGVHY